MGDSGDTVSTVIIIIVVCALLFFRLPSGGGSGWYVTISVSPAGSGTTSPSGLTFLKTGELLNVSATSAVNYTFVSWVLDNRTVSSASTMVIKAETTNGTHTLVATFQAKTTPPQATDISFYPSPTLRRGQNYTVNLFFRNNYKYLNNVHVRMERLYEIQPFSACSIGLTYAFRQALSYEDCWNRYTSSFVEHIDGVGSSGTYLLGSSSEWALQLTVSPTAELGTYEVYMHADGVNEAGKFVWFGDFPWNITITG